MTPTLLEFLSTLDWKLLEKQRSQLEEILSTRIISRRRKGVMQNIINLTNFWFAYQNRHVNEFKKQLLTFNWQQLKEDKLEYLYIQAFKSLTLAQKEAMEGVLNTIDYFQDAAIEELHLDKNKVFTLTKD